MRKKNLTVRNLLEDDLLLIVNYFHNADTEFLLKMGVDKSKLYEREHWIKLLSENLIISDKKKQLYYIIWVLNDIPIGHCNINKIILNQEAYMHLHLWQIDIRQKGLGLEFLKLSIPIFFEVFNLKKIYCEPYALNLAPNKILEKYGFEFIKKYMTTPGVFNFEQEVNRWCLTKGRQNQIGRL